MSLGAVVEQVRPPTRHGRGGGARARALGDEWDAEALGAVTIPLHRRVDTPGPVGASGRYPGSPGPDAKRLAPWSRGAELRAALRGGVARIGDKDRPICELRFSDGCLLLGRPGPRRLLALAANHGYSVRSGFVILRKNYRP